MLSQSCLIQTTSKFCVRIYCFLELEIRQSKGFINKDVLLLTLEDPKARVGSGGATVNALLVVAEHLSAKAGFEVCYLFISFLACSSRANGRDNNISSPNNGTAGDHGGALKFELYY